jgi:hypothetical protein
MHGCEDITSSASESDDSSTVVLFALRRLRCPPIPFIHFPLSSNSALSNSALLLRCGAPSSCWNTQADCCQQSWPTCIDSTIANSTGAALCTQLIDQDLASSPLVVDRLSPNANAVRKPRRIDETGPGGQGKGGTCHTHRKAEPCRQLKVGFG